MSVSDWLQPPFPEKIKREEEQADLFELVITCKTVCNQMLRITKDPLSIAGTRLVLNQMLDLVMEKVLDDSEVRPTTPFTSVADVMPD